MREGKGVSERKEKDRVSLCYIFIYTTGILVVYGSVKSRDGIMRGVDG